MENLGLRKEPLYRLLHRAQRSAPGQPGGYVAAEVELVDTTGTGFIVEVQGDEKLRPLGSQIARQRASWKSSRLVLSPFALLLMTLKTSISSRSVSPMKHMNGSSSTNH